MELFARGIVMKTLAIIFSLSALLLTACGSNNMSIKVDRMVDPATGKPSGCSASVLAGEDKDTMQRATRSVTMHGENCDVTVNFGSANESGAQQSTQLVTGVVNSLMPLMKTAGGVK